MEQTRPTFLGIGAHKAGTSWLYEQLITHPDVYMPPKKEIHFFDRSTKYLSPNILSVSSPFLRPWTLEKKDLSTTLHDSLRIGKLLLTGDLKQADWLRRWIFGYYSEEWYVDLFRQTKPHQVCGEITPSYSMLEPEDIARIKALNPEIKLLFMLRDPVDRAWSNIRFGVGKGRLQANLESTDEIIATLKQPGVVLRGDYERTLNNYLQYFDASQMLICFYEAIKYDPVGLMADITSFLDIPPFATDAIDHKRRVNSSKPRQMPKAVRDYLVETYAPSIDRLAGALGSYAEGWKMRHSQLVSSGAIAAEHPISSDLPPTVHP
ncbi:MAG: sulfotransferase domain-containing protein [Cyanobacteria bacterium J06623_5]